MAIQYATTTRNNRLDEITADAGATAHIQFWDGAVPATPPPAPAGTLLASCDCSNPPAPARLSRQPISNASLRCAAKNVPSVRSRLPLQVAIIC